MRNHELVVVKHGSSTVEGEKIADGEATGIDQNKVNFHVLQHLRLRKRGFLTTEVASGAVVAGRHYLEEMGLDLTDEKSLEDMSNNEITMYGTAQQLRHWQQAGKRQGMLVGQVLATHEQLDDHFENTSPGASIARCVIQATQKGSLIVTNESDAASMEEMEEYFKGLHATVRGEKRDPEADNDWLAARLAIATGAGTLLLLTNVNGLYVEGKLISELSVDEIPDVLAHCEGRDDSGKGGMQSKLLASEMATECGIDVVIGNAFSDVRELIDGEAGTRVVQ